MKVFSRFMAGALLALAMATSAQAHFLWIVTDPATSQARVYFSEGAEPDDPDLLDRIADLKLTRFEPRDKASEVAVAKQDDALVAPLDKAYGVSLSRKYGVIERGGESFLLNYHATSQVSAIPSDWQRLGNQVPLEIVLNQKGKQVELTVYWQGKPLSDAVIVVAGSGIEQAEGKTDAQGHFTIEPQKSGLLAVRVKHVENESGKFDDKAYNSVRHWTTLTVPVSVSTVQSLETSLPDVPKGITSFGGAVAGDWVYVYGGHWGGAHHYWKEGQSGEFLRLNVREPKGWETLPGGPRRTGTAMVAHDGKLYRIGGFEARNAEKEDADLHSMDDVQRFDPATGKWESLPAMPVPRSSHDAAVLGGTLYVVGGWNIQKRGEGEFLDSMLTLDLKADKPKWKVLQVPFKRRAISAAAHDGKLYVMGGMQETGGATTRVDVYDPQTKTWSRGPSLHGTDMEGFGSTSFEIGGKLTTITMSGAIQQLANDGKSWVIAGQLKHPRFFARLLPIASNRGIVIAGAHMGSGKIMQTEVIGASDIVSQK
jgi:N-acetylneuraminic acid mutarotase/uncharacterized GH25 family protein